MWWLQLLLLLVYDFQSNHFFIHSQFVMWNGQHRIKSYITSSQLHRTHNIDWRPVWRKIYQHTYRRRCRVRVHARVSGMRRFYLMITLDIESKWMWMRACHPCVWWWRFFLKKNATYDMCVYVCLHTLSMCCPHKHSTIWNCYILN